MVIAEATKDGIYFWLQHFCRVRNTRVSGMNRSETAIINNEEREKCKEGGTIQNSR